MKIESGIFSKLWRHHVGHIVEISHEKTNGEIIRLDEVIGETRQETGRFIYVIAIGQTKAQIHGHYNLNED